MDRRTSLKLFAVAAPLTALAGCTWTKEDTDHAQHQARAARAAGYDGDRQFFTPHEFETAGILANLILPADSRSGSATDLHVPEFMDFMIADQAYLQVPIRGGLAWLDGHSRRRFNAPFKELKAEQQRGILDEIAYPESAEPGVQHGVAFFNRFRDLTASGFWSTKEGMADLQYIGNTANFDWKGAPPEEMQRLGLTFDGWEVA